MSIIYTGSDFFDVLVMIRIITNRGAQVLCCAQIGNRIEFYHDNYFLLEPVWLIFLYFTSNFGESKIFSEVAHRCDDIFFSYEKIASCYAILALSNPKDAASYP